MLHPASDELGAVQSRTSALEVVLNSHFSKPLRSLSCRAAHEQWDRGPNQQFAIIALMERFGSSVNFLSRFLLVAPFAACGQSDVIARLMGLWLSERLAQKRAWPYRWRADQ
jgi:hypothetical protein